MPNAPASSAAYLKALGLTSLDLQSKGLANYNALLQAYPRTQTGSTTTDNNVMQAMYKAAPDPFAAAMANLAASKTGIGAGRASVPGTQPMNLNGTPQSAYNIPDRNTRSSQGNSDIMQQLGPYGQAKTNAYAPMTWDDEEWVGGTPQEMYYKGPADVFSGWAGGTPEELYNFNIPDDPTSGAMNLNP